MNHRFPCWVTVFIIFGCGSKPEPAPQSSTATVADPKSKPFVELSEQVGLNFIYDNGASGEYFYCEILGAGGALLDFDQDGDLDIFLVQGHHLGEKPDPDPLPEGIPRRHALFRNNLIGPEGEPGEFTFTEVGSEAGIRSGDYGMGAAVGDIDNDGYPDLYVTNFGENRLYRNRGNGTFKDVTNAAGVGESHWSVSAAFFDYDRDGWLDLFIGNYADYQLENNKVCYGATRDYCSPLSYGPVPDRLLRNRGDGSFEDVTQQAGIDKAFGRALGVVTSDLNGDGFVDIYVANDGTVNQYWINLGDGTFEDRAVMSGNGLNESGLPEAGMGVDAGDFDHDGDDDLFVTHLFGETNTLYINDGNGHFEDYTNIAGLGAASQPYTGFGTAWLDYDLDGKLDLFVANGAVTKLDALLRENDPFPFKQRNQLFHNLGDNRFEDLSDDVGNAFRLARVSRGAMFGDLNNDGAEDIVVANNGGRASLLLNQTVDKTWLGLRIVDPALRRDALGARVYVYFESGKMLSRRVRTDASYASAHDSRVVFGLDDGADAIQGFTVVWPDGAAERWLQVDAFNRWLTIERGSGEALP